jgi:KDO2-lipid IV(A) lauroyltransferase
MKKMTHIGYYMVYGGIFILSILPLPVLYFLADIACFFVYRVFRYRRDVVVQNLSRAFPEKRYDEIRRIGQKFYHSFTDCFVEMGKMFTVSSRLMEKKVRFSGISVMEDYIGEGRNVIVSLGHCGNWEMLTFIPRKLKSDVYAVYKPLRNKIFDRLMLRMRSRFGVKPIPADAVARRFLNKNNPPAVYFFLADQCPKTVNEDNRCIFLNQPTGVYRGIEKLAKATASAVVFFRVIRESRGCYLADCIPICDNARTEHTDITSSYIHLLEENIKAEPSGWLWTHKRWKR